MSVRFATNPYNPVSRMSVQFATNPLRGRQIRVGGAGWRALTKPKRQALSLGLGLSNAPAALVAPARAVRPNGRALSLPRSHKSEHSDGGCRSGGATGRSGGARLRKRRVPIFRMSPLRKGPMESATDFTIGTVREGNDGYFWQVIKSGRTRRWKRL